MANDMNIEMNSDTLGAADLSSIFENRSRYKKIFVSSELVAQLPCVHNNISLARICIAKPTAYNLIAGRDQTNSR